MIAPRPQHPKTSITAICHTNINYYSALSIAKQLHYLITQFRISSRMVNIIKPSTLPLIALPYGTVLLPGVVRTLPPFRPIATQGSVRAHTQSSE